MIIARYGISSIVGEVACMGCVMSRLVSSYAPVQVEWSLSPSDAAAVKGRHCPLFHSRYCVPFASYLSFTRDFGINL